MDAYRSSHLDLKQCQKLMGSVNDLAQMCPFIKFYKGSGNRLLAQFGNNNCILLQTPDQLKKDLLVISKVAESCKSGLPIAIHFIRNGSKPIVTQKVRFMHVKQLD